MPQMAPMNWTSLYLFFTFLFLLMMVMNFYSFLYSPSQIKNMKLNNKNSLKYLIWKW
uniref:ATP synthase complex subunit 8 n=2 Tax=Curculionoidea TaxID=71529 RepID=A0A343A631_9CUCU|nr:ATP synthase F0 subunit 8 [Scolytinae sp. BMNH 1040265]AOY40270.1 ATP synthase F0 subunit 8 [Curculionoidea sp. 2 KM-2015]